MSRLTPPRRPADPPPDLPRRLVAEFLGTGLLVTVVAYSTAQTVGGVAGATLADAMHRVPLTELSVADRSGAPLWLGEVVATAGLVALVFTLARTGRGALAAPAVGGCIGAAYRFTSSTSFANPAVIVGRVFSDTFAGIAPGSVPGFVVAQLVGAALAVALVRWLHPGTGLEDSLGDVVVPQHGAAGTVAGTGRPTETDRSQR